MAVEWSGDDWQEHCDLLFVEHHSPGGYQRIPDTDRGDLGLEGFSIDGTGCGYQCFATEKTEVAARYRAQRDKMTTDLKKLVDRKDRVQELLGTHQLRRWVFMVPVHDSKELIIHARKKEGELRAKGLPFIAEDFVIVIHTEGDFQKELAIIESYGVGAVGTVPIEVGDEDLRQLTEDEPEQVQTLDRKLSKVVPDPKDLRERFLRHAVDGGNIREHLRRNHPQTNEQVAGQVANEARDVLAERDLGELHKGSITEVRKRLEDRLRDRVTALGDDQASRLAYATVATWLMECPLDFPEQN